MEEEGNLGAGGSATAPNAGGEGTSASQPGTGESPVLRLCFSLTLFLASLLPLLPRPSCRGSKPDSRVGVGMERQGPSYGEVVNTRDVRVQALLGGSNSPTSRSPEAVEWIMNI